MDQKTLEGLINDNKDSDAAAAEQGFAAGFALYNGSTPGASSLVFQQLASDATFFQDSSGTTFPSFQKYVNYFGTDQYMDISCLAGFQRQDADFSATGGPNFEYSLYDPRGRAGT